jgi:hypothetical protein
VITNAGQVNDGVFDGRQLTWVQDVSAGLVSAFFFAEHATHTANTVLTLCAEQLGLSAADFGQRQMRLSIKIEDSFFGGPGDGIADILVTPGLQRFVGISAGDIPAYNQGILQWLDLSKMPEIAWPDEQTNTPELGLMIFSNMDRGVERRGAATAETEVLFLRPQ